MRRRTDVNFTEGPILKNMLLFAIPLAASGILQLLFNAADTVVVGRFAGPNELAAVGATGSAVNLIVNLCIGFSIGANVLVARRIGEKDAEGVSRAVHTSMFLSVFLGLIAGLIGFFLAPRLLEVMDTPEVILPSASAYLRVYFIGVPASIIYNFGASVLRARGDSTRPLYFLVAAGVVNVLLNLIFVIGFGMGAVGVGAATAISQFVSAFLVVICLVHEHSAVKLFFRKLCFHKKETLSVIGIGLPAGLQSCLFNISNIIVQASVNSFGSAAVVAGSAAAANLEGFVSGALGAFYQSQLTFGGQNYGAGKLGRIDKGLAVSTGCVVVLGFVLGGLLWMFDGPLLSIYTSDPEVIHYGSIRISYMALSMILNGAMNTFMGSIRSMGYSVLTMCVTAFGACGLRILWIYTVFAANPTIGNVFIAYPITWTTTLCMHITCYFIVRKREQKKLLANIPE